MNPDTSYFVFRCVMVYFFSFFGWGILFSCSHMLQYINILVGIMLYIDFLRTIKNPDNKFAEILSDFFSKQDIQTKILTFLEFSFGGLCLILFYTIIFLIITSNNPPGGTRT